jgi:hypothetical protein
MNTPYEKEWFDEPGYCNCLLVTMSRARIPSLEIRAGDIVPNLEVLAASKPDTAAWIRAQEFQYSLLSSTAVINILNV